ncbi:MAG: hypothetical protein ACOCUR_00650 [Nanoarchaeota archaeon]
MSLLPEKTNGQVFLKFEERKWDASGIGKLEGKVLEKFSELKELLSGNENFGKVFLNKAESNRDYIVYSREEHREGIIKKINVAYRCSHCESIVIGAPSYRVKDYNGTETLTTGIEGYELRCKECSHLLKENIQKIS